MTLLSLSDERYLIEEIQKVNIFLEFAVESYNAPRPPVHLKRLSLPGLKRNPLFLKQKTSAETCAKKSSISSDCLKHIK